MSTEFTSEFLAKVMQPKKAGDDFVAFVVLPKEVSEQLPRRGRTSVDIKVAEYQFTVTLEPDGKLSHWVKLTENDLAQAKINLGSEVLFTLTPCAEEPEPNLPDDLKAALYQCDRALETWQATTTIARVDWLHWVESAKQSKTRTKRIADACNMLAEGKRRVCCFDSSGFYSKALSAPKV